MQAGRWKDTRMPMRYGEKVLASRGAMARAAKAKGEPNQDREQRQLGIYCAIAEAKWKSRLKRPGCT